MTEQKEVDKDNRTRRVITYIYDDEGNLKSEQRQGVDIGKRDESVWYGYDDGNRLVKTNIDGIVTNYTYDNAGNLLNDGTYTYTYDATGARVQTVQVRQNVNSGYQNSGLNDGSGGVDYIEFFSDGRNDWQKTWESEVGTIHQNNLETVTTDYIVDYLSAGNRDLIATEQGSLTKRYVYDGTGERISAEFAYADNTQRGQPGENIASDIGVGINKVWYRSSHLGSSLFTVDETGKVIGHTIYDPWGKPLTEPTVDLNHSGMDNGNNYTGYTYDVVLDLYFAQNRFYDPQNHRFTQEDIIKDGHNWYAYVANNPLMYVDKWGLATKEILNMAAEANFRDSSVLPNNNSQFYAMTLLAASGGNVFLGFHNVAQMLAYEVLRRRGMPFVELEKGLPNGTRADVVGWDGATAYVAEIKPLGQLAYLKDGKTPKSTFRDAIKQLEGYIEQLTCDKNGAKMFQNAHPVAGIIMNPRTIFKNDWIEFTMALSSPMSGIVGYQMHVRRNMRDQSLTGLVPIPLADARKEMQEHITKHRYGMQEQALADISSALGKGVLGIYAVTAITATTVVAGAIVVPAVAAKLATVSSSAVAWYAAATAQSGQLIDKIIVEVSKGKYEAYKVAMTPG